LIEKSRMRLIAGPESGRAGRWKKRLRLSPGRYEYRFILDGDRQNHPNACANDWPTRASAGKASLSPGAGVVKVNSPVIEVINPALKYCV